MKRGLVIAALVYLPALAALVPAMFSLRRHVLVTLGQPDEIRQWEAWRAAAAEQATEGPVSRRPPSSAEPPALVLMRDHFGNVLTAAVVFGSLLYWMLALAIRGVIGPSNRRPPPGANGADRAGC